MQTSNRINRLGNDAQPVATACRLTRYKASILAARTLIEEPDYTLATAFDAICRSAGRRVNHEQMVTLCVVLPGFIAKGIQNELLDEKLCTDSGSFG
jgi:hypothetical protein